MVIIMHGGSRMTIDPRISTRPGRSTVGFSPTRQTFGSTNRKALPGGGVLTPCTAEVVWALTTHAFREGAQFLLLLEMRPTPSHALIPRSAYKRFVYQAGITLTLKERAKRREVWGESPNG